MSAQYDDTDDDAQRYVRGPGRRPRCTPGPVITAYADIDMDEPCSGCGVGPFEFCRHPDGTLRKIPCQQRLRKANR